MEQQEQELNQNNQYVRRKRRLKELNGKIDNFATNRKSSLIKMSDLTVLSQSKNLITQIDKVEFQLRSKNSKFPKYFDDTDYSIIINASQNFDCEKYKYKEQVCNY